jgi:ubiquinone/menaquinone biosynthesis C-methylase UbiE
VDVVEQTIETYDKIASRYCSKTREPKIEEWKEGYIKKFLSYFPRKHPLILNVGCGDGRDNMHIEKSGAKAIGIDLSKGMLREAKKLYAQGDFRIMDMRHLEFNDDSFDGIWASGSIYHVPKSQVSQVIQEFRRVHKIDGVASLNFKLGTGEGMEANPKSYGGYPRYFAYYSKEEMKALFDTHDFKELESCMYPEEIYKDRIQQMWFRLLDK